MKINEYQDLAMRTASVDTNLLNGVLCLCGESGEVADLMKKHLFQGHPLNEEKMADELGDICWYIAISARYLGYDLETIMALNVQKLERRYPSGFSAERSLNRKENTVKKD